MYIIINISQHQFNKYYIFNVTIDYNKINNIYMVILIIFFILIL